MRSPKNRKKALIILINYILVIFIIILPVITGQTESPNTCLILHTRFNKILLEGSNLLSDFNAASSVNSSTSLAQDGLNFFFAKLRNKTSSRGYLLAILDMQGNIKYSMFADTEFRFPDFFNSTTVMYSYDGKIQLTNLESNKTERLSVPGGHHDVEYNPFTDTFLTLQYRRIGTYQDLPILYDDIIEYDRQGNQLWLWNCSEHIPFNASHYLNEIAYKAQDWTHANTIFWSVEEDYIYYNPRKLDTFYKIDKRTGEIIWAVGKLGDFTLYDKHGNKRTTLWWHSHALEMIGPNRFVLFDNDYMNQTYLLNHRSRLVEIVVDEETMTATEVWSWTSPKEYYCAVWGDADRLPNGNTLGAFGDSTSHPTYLTEITPGGEIAWQMKFDHSSEIRVHFYGSERFFEGPLVKIRKYSEERENFSIDLSLWDTYRTRYHSKGKIKVLTADHSLLMEKAFEFLPYWQETALSLEIPYPALNKSDLKIIVENADGKTTEKNLSDWVGDNTTTTNKQMSGFLHFSLGSIIIMVVTILSHRKRSRENQRK